MKRLFILIPITLLLGGCSQNPAEIKCDGMAKVYCQSYDTYDTELKCLRMDVKLGCMAHSCIIACEDVMLMGEYDMNGKPL